MPNGLEGVPQAQLPPSFQGLIKVREDLAFLPALASASSHSLLSP